MESNSIEKKKQDIKQLLEKRRLNEAFAGLKDLATEASDWSVRSKIDELEQSYRYMILYVTDGVTDPQRNTIYESIVTQCYELCDLAANESVARISPKLHYSTLRIERMRPENLGLLLSRYAKTVDDENIYAALPDDRRNDDHLSALKQAKENIANMIFKHVWVAFPVPADELEAIRHLTTESSPSQDTTLRELVMSAVMMNLIEHYSETLLLVLLDMYACESLPRQLRIKALCCALIVMYKYRDIIRHSGNIADRFKVLAGNDSTGNDIMTIFLQFIRSRSTERIMKKVQDELVPELMKLRPELRRKFQDINFADDPESLAQNPDWQEMLDKSGFTKKMQELNKLQMEGSDVFLSSFARLKSFPFFNDIANWFLPFDPSHSAVFRIMKPANNAVSLILSRNSALCDSDKYSFALSVASMPDRQRETIIGQFSEQNAQMMEMADAELADPQKETENTANKFVQHLYRFFNLFSRKSEFYNPFSTTLNLLDVPFAGDLISQPERILLIAEFYFRQECYPNALTLFSRLTECGNADFSLYQKIGYCYERGKDSAKAVTAYEKADLLKPGDAWTLKHLTACYRTVHNMEKAVECARSLTSLQPDSPAAASTLANCLLEAGKPDEALEYYFKIDYLADKGARTKRPIAWCSFLSGNFNQSLDYYDRILSLDALPDDMVNRGHVLFALGRTKEAVASYEKAAQTEGYGTYTLLSTYDGDADTLRNAGVTEADIAIVRDKLRYDLLS